MTRTSALLSCLLSALLCRGAWAQATPPSVSEVRAAQVAQLQAWGAKGIIENSSPLNLDVRAADLQAARATEPLQNWVRAGGIVILHTDAAQAFGFQTVQARERTFNRAGQLWGRGGNALPFGGSPLLLGGRSPSRRGQTDGIPGVRTVFYQLEKGDALLRDSGAAVVPLLRVEDNTLPEDNKAEPTFYAAAMRRYGKGWALFLPRIIEARADGAKFQQNLETFVADASDSKWLTLPVAAIQAAYQPASQQRQVDWQELRNALRPLQDQKVLPPVSDEAQLILSFDDAKATDSALQQVEAAPNDEGLQTSGRALVYLLRARALWQLDSDDGTPSADGKLTALWGASSKARETLWQTQSGGPAANMTRWWNGVFALGAALPPIPIKYQPELIAFSYARPALEAAQWWQGIQSTTESLNKIVAIVGPAAQQMMKQHQNDPPLLSYWRTDGGTKYYLQLAPIQAASDEFPALPKDWGMPLRNNTTFLSDLFGNLAPIGNGNEMSVGIIPQPITYPQANAVTAKTFWLCSQYWSGELPNELGLWQGQSNVLLEPAISELERKGSTLVETIFLYFSFLRDDKIMQKNYVHRPIPTWKAYLYLQVESGDIKNVNNDQEVQSRFDKYNHQLLNKWLFNLEAAMLTPARVSRLQARLQTKFWLENQVAPDWIDDGVQNAFSLAMAKIIFRSRKNISNIRPSPPLSNTRDGYPRYYWSDRMERAARNQSVAAEDPEVEPTSINSGGDRDFDGTPLIQLDSTHQVAYFYQRFGAGAFVETLQRLGSGQTIDAALRATTGLNQQQFFAAAANAN